MPPRKRHESFADDEQPSSSSSKPSSSRKHQQKKTRFVSPSDDPAKFADEVDSALEKPSSMTRKGRVKTEGYESDSSDDGEGVVLSRRADKDKGEGGDEDDDMFAMGEKGEKDDADDGDGKPKKDEFLRLGDIEGQEFNDASGGEDDESDISDEPVDEDEAERRRKAGMGYELSSFNMREEMEEGKFAADGTFVRSFDPHAMHDRWMEGTDEREIKKARRAKRAQEKKERERIRAEAREEAERGKGKDDMEVEMLGFLKRGETVVEALARLGERAKKDKQKQKRDRKSHPKDQAMDTDKPLPKFSTSPSKAKDAIDRITTLASELLALGDVEVYSKTYEHFLRSVRSAGHVDPDWAPPSTKYEYKWDVPGATAADGATELKEQTFGPFVEEEMKAWYDAQYFGSVGEKVKVRVVGGEWGSWDDVVE